MTEKEQKAIEELLLETVKNYEEYYKDTEALILTEISRDYKNSKIILNLISKLQADIEIKDKVIDLMADKLSERSEWYTKERWKEICYKQVEKVGGEDE